MTSKTKNSIVALFVRHRGKSSIWQRKDTGEEMTERQLRKQAKAERRPVIMAYGPVMKEMERGA